LGINELIEKRHSQRGEGGRFENFLLNSKGKCNRGERVLRKSYRGDQSLLPLGRRPGRDQKIEEEGSTIRSCYKRRSCSVEKQKGNKRKKAAQQKGSSCPEIAKEQRGGKIGGKFQRRTRKSS